ncbi:MAG: hypothetical protein A2284_03045 [Deltaproteobacteria bacterium RIFOXYA12_FULL_61_11]|nr:MAG: hypothetical protein A2284_03045 [Deltaproteobacteria bacterium RIFOXYA12_FULL_61_11]
MKTYSISILVCAAFIAGCAAHAPRELVNAREVYRRASTGPAAQVAPAELHVATQALDKAEKSFKEDPDSYVTRDLAYIAQRRAEIAEATASIIFEQKGNTLAKKDYQEMQTKIVEQTKQDLTQTRTALAESERSGESSAAKLSVEQDARIASDQRAATAQTDRIAAENRALAAQAALAKLGEVKNEPRGIVVTLSGSLLFASNVTTLLPAAMARLDQVAEVLLNNSERRLMIEGHTDSQGTNSHNLQLSQGRADAVRSYFIQKHYRANLIQAQGFGETHPIADNSSAEGRANNRRVEIIIERDPTVSSQ